MNAARLIRYLGNSSSIITDVLFSFNKIQRTNAAILLDAYPANVALTEARWEIREMATDTLVGLSFDLHASIPAISTPGLYYITFKGKTATDQYFRKWDDILIWYPRFLESEADIVINMASGNYFNDFAGADNSGKKIYVKGTGTGYFAALNLRGSAGFANHVRVQGNNVIQTGVNGSDAVSFGGARYVFIDNNNSDSTSTPSWEVINPTGSNFEFRCENTYGPVTDLYITGFKLGRTGASTDRASISIIPPVNTTYNASNWLSNNITILNNTISNSGAETIYVFYTNDSPQSGFTPPKSINTVIAWNTITNAGNDAIQLSSAISARVHDNLINTWGIQLAQSHENAISWNEGNSGECYNNYAINGKMAINAKSGLYPYNIFTGQTTAQRVAFYGNVFIQGTPPSGGTTEPVFNYFQNAGSNTAAWPVEIFSNTFVCNKLGMTFAFASGGWTCPNFKLFNNIFVKTGTAGEYPELDFSGAGTYPTSPTVNNLVRNFSSYTDILFTNIAGGDYSISSLSSPAFTGASNTASLISGIDLYDYQGLPLLGNSAYAHGAYGGYNLKVITPSTDDPNPATFTTPVAIGSLTQTGGTITFETNKEGLLFWVVVANNDTAPTEAQIIAGKNAAGTNAISSGDILDGGTAGSGVTSGGVESTAYDLWYVFKTVDFVVGTKGKVDFTTAADVTAPTLSLWEIRNANPDRIYFRSSEIITATTFGGFSFTDDLGTAKTVTGITINAGQLTDHYLTVSSNFTAIDYLVKIAYSGSGSNIKDTSIAQNPLASFGATLITNNITYSKKINVNLTSFGQNLAAAPWNDADFSTAGVQTIISNLVDNNASSTGYSLAVNNAFHALNNSVNATAGVYISTLAVLVRGLESYSNGDATGTLRFAGLTSGKAFDLIYLIKNTFGTGAGNINVNGAGAVGYTTGTVERKVSGIVDGSGNIDIVMTQTAPNTSECMVGMILITYP